MCLVATDAGPIPSVGRRRPRIAAVQRTVVARLRCLYVRETAEGERGGSECRNVTAEDRSGN